MKRKNYLPAIMSIVSLSFALFLVSFGLTGYSILGIGTFEFRNFSIGFFLVGLVFAFFYLKNNKQNKKEK